MLDCEPLTKFPSGFHSQFCQGSRKENRFPKSQTLILKRDEMQSENWATELKRRSHETKDLNQTRTSNNCQENITGEINIQTKVPGRHCPNERTQIKVREQSEVHSNGDLKRHFKVHVTYVQRTFDRSNENKNFPLTFLDVELTFL